MSQQILKAKEVSGQHYILLPLIYSVIKFKVFVNLPKGFHGPLGCEIVLQLANWPCY